MASLQLNLSNVFCFMAEEDPRETVRLDSPRTHWKTMREKKAIEAERKVSSDENEALGQNEESPKQGLSTIWQLSNLYLGVYPGNAVRSPTVTSFFFF